MATEGAGTGSGGALWGAGVSRAWGAGAALAVAGIAAATVAGWATDERTAMYAPTPAAPTQPAPTNATTRIFEVMAYAQGARPVPSQTLPFFKACRTREEDRGQARSPRANSHTVLRIANFRREAGVGPARPGGFPE